MKLLQGIRYYLQLLLQPRQFAERNNFRGGILTVEDGRSVILLNPPPTEGHQTFYLLAELPEGLDSMTVLGTLLRMFPEVIRITFLRQDQNNYEIRVYVLCPTDLKGVGNTVRTLAGLGLTFPLDFIERITWQFAGQYYDV